MEYESFLSEETSEETSQEFSEETSELTSEETSESSQVYSETYIDYTPFFDNVIHNQQIFIGLFVALVSLVGVGILLKYFFGFMK